MSFLTSHNGNNKNNIRSLLYKIMNAAVVLLEDRAKVKFHLLDKYRIKLLLLMNRDRSMVIVQGLLPLIIFDLMKS